MLTDDPEALAYPSLGIWFFSGFDFAGGVVASDLLSDLTAAEIAVTGTVTATISRMHVCSGTSANYTVTLPAASGNTGKLIGFRMAGIAALSKLVTIDGNASETIDGATTRIMWAGESALLLCDGSNWFKIAGNTRPMVCRLYLSTNQTGVVHSTTTKVTLDTVVLDNTALMGNTGSNRIDVVRPGEYSVSGSVQWDNLSEAQADIETLTKQNATTEIFSSAQAVSLTGTYPSPYGVAPFTLAAGDYVELYGYHLGSGGTANQTIRGLLKRTALAVEELPSW